MPVYSVGAMGDARTYDQPIALRAVMRERHALPQRFFSPAEMLAMARAAGFREVAHVSAADHTRRYFAGRTDGLRPGSEELLVARTQAEVDSGCRNRRGSNVLRSHIGNRLISMMRTHYRWVIVAAGALLSCVALGSLFSLPVFLTPLTRDTGWSVTGVSSAMTIAFLAMAGGSMGWGSLSDRIGPRAVVLAGSVMLAASLALASQADSLIEFQLVFGILVGGGAAGIFAPMMACVTGWFDTHRSLAVSLVSAGMGVAPMTMSPLVGWLVTGHDWRTTLLIVAAIAAGTMLPAALLVRRAPALEAVAGAPAGSAAAEPAASVGQVLRSPAFLILMLTNFFCCATHSGPIIHTVSYAVTCGIPLLVAVSIYSVEGLAGLGGRVALGLLGDRFGAKRVLVIGLLVQAFGALAYVFARDLAVFYAVAAVFGFIYAGVMPLYSVLARENFPLRMMGTVIGGLAMAGGLGMATGPLTGGLIYDELGTYRWLYIGAWGIGIGAFLIALTFKPMPKSARAPVTAAA